MGWLEDAQNAVSGALSDAQATAVPALESAAEGYFANVLTQQKKQTDATLAKNIKTIQERPVVPGSFSSYLQSAVQGPFIKEYGPYVLVGAVVLVGLGLYLRGK